MKNYDVLEFESISELEGEISRHTQRGTKLIEEFGNVEKGLSGENRTAELLNEEINKLQSDLGKYEEIADP